MLFLYRFRLTLCLRSAKDKYLFLLQTTHFAIKTKTKHPPSSSADLTRTCIRRRLPFAFDTLHSLRTSMLRHRMASSVKIYADMLQTYTRINSRKNSGQKEIILAPFV